MGTTEWKWQTKDGLEIYSKAWEPSKKARGVVHLLHGMGEHIGRYQAVAEALTGAGYILVGFDFRGCGNSEGKRGHTPSIETYFEDIDIFLAETAKRYPGLPGFLYGHSLGAIAVLAYTPLRKSGVRGVIATGSALINSIQEQKFKLFLVKFLGTLAPTMTIENGLDPNTLSRDPQVAKDYISDPLVHKLVTLGWGKASLGIIRLAFEKAPEFPIPLLLMHGTKDALAYPSSSTKFAGLAPKDKVTLKMWDGLFHEIHHEPEKADVFRYMIDWLDKQNK